MWKAKTGALSFWDLRNFYDTTRIAALVRQGIRLEFPPSVMYMAVASYQSAGVLRAKDNACSEWIISHDSVLAGCSLANDMARCAVYDMCEEISMASARAELSQYVDDFTQYATHPSVLFLAMAASKDAVAFAAAVRANSFDLL